MTSTASPIRVLIVDDSALARRAIADALALDPAIEVVGVAADPYAAREKILALEPDVITLDIEMPLMDGLTFLKILQEHHPIPVVIVSGMTPAGSELALAALAAGAIDVIKKPDGSGSLGEVAWRLATQVKAAARARLRPAGAPTDTLVAAAAPSVPRDPTGRRVLLLGASTGGVEALRFLLPRLPDGLPPIVIVQHIPATFSSIMASHLNLLAPFEVREAVDGLALRPGLCVIAPGDFHVALAPQGNGYRLRVMRSPAVNHCRPSVDVLFRSGAEHAGKHAVGVLLTGMGSDGARGLQLMRAAGARTLAESQESCVVFGMPQAAIRLDAVDEVVPLPRMPAAIINALVGRGTS